MTVFLVVHREWEGSYVRGVFADPRQAESKVPTPDICPSTNHGGREGMHPTPDGGWTRKAENCVSSTKHDRDCCSVDDWTVLGADDSHGPGVTRASG